jgi:hypothetical protein
MFEQLPSLRFLIILVQTTTLICATPLPPDSQNREAFTLAQVERGTYIKNGAYEIARTYAKYGVWPSGDLLAAAAAREEEIQGIFASGYGYDEPKNGTAPAVPRDEWDTMYVLRSLLLRRFACHGWEGSGGLLTSVRKSRERLGDVRG